MDVEVQVLSRALVTPMNRLIHGRVFYSFLIGGKKITLVQDGTELL